MTQEEREAVNEQLDIIAAALEALEELSVEELSPQHFNTLFEIIEEWKSVTND